MGRTLPLLLGIGLMVMLSGCGDGHQEDLKAVQQDMWTAYLAARNQTSDAIKRRALIYANPLFMDAQRRRDSLFAYGPVVRHLRGDSVTHSDSVMYADIVLNRISSELYHKGDTLTAAFTYLQYLPWLSVYALDRRAEEIRFYAEALGDALSITHSPNMARLAYQAFERARQLALASEDLTLYHLADSSYRAVAGQVLTMPDSVRHAFGPVPDAPAHVPWGLTLLAAVFMLTQIAGVGRWNREA